MSSARFDADFLHLNGKRYPIALEGQLHGKRGITRNGARASQISDPGRLQQADWPLSGPLGNSREGKDGVLGIDYATLEHRYDGLLTSPAEGNVVDLTGFEDAGSGGTTSDLPQTLPFNLEGTNATAATIDNNDAGGTQSHAHTHTDTASTQAATVSAATPTMPAPPHPPGV